MGQHQRLAWHDVCPTSHEVQICVAASPACHPSSYHPQQPDFLGLRISRLLLGRPAVNASESNCAHFLDARLELFWAEDWSALWAMVRAECDVAPVQNTTRRTEKQQMQSRIRKVATHVGTHPVRTASGAKRSASTALAGTHDSTGSTLRTDAGLFPKPKAVILPMVNFGHRQSNGPSPIATADSDIMHHQFRLSLLQWNPGPARRNPTNIVSAACGRFHAVILQEASDHVPHISDYFRAYTDNTDLAILLNMDTFEPDPTVLTFKADSTSKNTWGMVLLIVRALLRRPSVSGTPTVTFCSVHIHNVVAKKRDASADLLQFLHAKMLEHNVDFIGGDFNMSAFSTVSDVFSDPEFSAPGHSCLWGLGALDEQHRECTGFLIMPKRPYEWRVDSHGCYKLDNSALGLGPRDQSAHLPVFLHLRNTNIPGPSSVMRSEQAQQRRFERRHNKERRQR